MNIWDLKYIDGIVVGKTNDPSASGSVRVKLLGFTDELDDNQQPWATPVVSSISNVPEIGTYVKVVVGNYGDPLFLQYIAQGTTPESYIPSEYIENYPNTVVSNMGIRYLYNKSLNITDETDITTGYNRNIDATGKTTITTPKSYSIESKDRVDASPVLTSDSVNLCTGRPVGQGSDYLSIPTFKETTIEISGGTLGQL